MTTANPEPHYSAGTVEDGARLTKLSRRTSPPRD